DLRALARAAPEIPVDRVDAVRDRAALDPALRDRVPPRTGRNLLLPPAPDQPPGTDPGPLRLPRGARAGQGVLHPAPGAPDRDARDVRRPRRVPLLCVLGADAAADVPAHRSLGRQAARLRGGQ